MVLFKLENEKWKFFFSKIIQAKNVTEFKGFTSN